MSSFLFSEMSLVDPNAPAEFPEFDENISIDFKCASCGYKWSGGSGGEDEQDDAEAGKKSCPRCSAPLEIEKPPETFSLFGVPDESEIAYDGL